MAASASLSIIPPLIWYFARKICCEIIGFSNEKARLSLFNSDADGFIPAHLAEGKKNSLEHTWYFCNEYWKPHLVWHLKEKIVFIKNRRLVICYAPGTRRRRRRRCVKLNYIKKSILCKRPSNARFYREWRKIFVFFSPLLKSYINHEYDLFIKYYGWINICDWCSKKKYHRLQIDGHQTN